MARSFEERHVIELVKRHGEGNQGLMNKVLIMGGLGWGLEMNELTDLQVRHVLHPNGKLKREWLLPKDMSANGHPRSINTNNEVLISVLNEYLDQMAAEGDSEGVHGEYRSIKPTRLVFTNAAGERLGMQKRGKTRGTATGLRNHFQRLIDRSSLKGGGFTPASLRKTWALNMHRSGADIRTIMAAAGMRSVQAAKNLVYDDAETVKARMTTMYRKMK